MSDDLHLILTLLTKHDEMMRVVVSVKHGLNKFPNYPYYEDPDILEKYKEILPLHVTSSMKKILKVEEVFDVVVVN